MDRVTGIVGELLMEATFHPDDPLLMVALRNKHCLTSLANDETAAVGRAGWLY